MINPMDLTGKRILVTGASSGIGRATAIQLSKLGAKVVMIARREDKLKETLNLLVGRGHGYYTFDLTNIDGIEELIKTIVSDFGMFNGFVHSAGIGKPRPVAMLKYENILEIMNINFYAFVEIVRCITKKKSFAQCGSIVGISSISSIKGYKSKVAYNASKASMDSAIRCMALELADKRIRVNSVMPGWVATGMYSSYVSRTEISAEQNENINRQFLGITEPHEIANVVAFLLSDATNTITGTSLLIDGGLLQG